MKIKINKDGSLEIERAGRGRKQYCPFVLEAVDCGDWCPLFGEPEIFTKEKFNQDRDGDTTVNLVTTISRIDLCHITLEGEITDKRGK